MCTRCDFLTITDDGSGEPLFVCYPLIKKLRQVIDTSYKFITKAQFTTACITVQFLYHKHNLPMQENFLMERDNLRLLTPKMLMMCNFEMLREHC